MSNGSYAIVLAAGLSTRMGVCKTSLPWADSTLLAYQMTQWLIAGVTPIVVLGPHNRDRQQDCPPGSQVVINPHPDSGKVSSILVGLQHLPPVTTRIAIAAVDQPRPAWIYQRLLQAHTAAPATVLTVPTYQGRLGHPLIFASSLRSRLTQISEATLGLRQIVQAVAAQTQHVEFDTPIVLADLNTPDQYQSGRFVAMPTDDFG